MVGMEGFANMLLTASRVAGAVGVYGMHRDHKAELARLKASYEPKDEPPAEEAPPAPAPKGPGGKPIKAAAVPSVPSRPGGSGPYTPPFVSPRSSAAVRPTAPFNPAKVKSEAAKKVMGVTDPAALKDLHNGLLRSRLERTISDADYEEASKAVSHQRGNLRVQGEQASAASSHEGMKGHRTALWSQNTVPGLDQVRQNVEADPSLSHEDRGYLLSSHAALRNRFPAGDRQAGPRDRYEGDRPGQQFNTRPAEGAPAPLASPIERPAKAVPRARAKTAPKTAPQVSAVAKALSEPMVAKALSEDDPPGQFTASRAVPGRTLAPQPPPRKPRKMIPASHAALENHVDDLLDTNWDKSEPPLGQWMEKQAKKFRDEHQIG